MAFAPLRMETRAGKTMHAGGRKITPFSQALILSFPGMPGGLIWNRPVSVLVREPDGSEIVIPVVDRTRQVELALLGVIAGFSLFLFISRILITRKPSGE